MAASNNVVVVSEEINKLGDSLGLQRYMNWGREEFPQISGLGNWFHHGIIYHVRVYFKESGQGAGEGNDEFTFRLNHEIWDFGVSK